MTIQITLSVLGNETGPFDLYSDVDNFITPFITNVPRASFLSTYEVEAPDETTIVKIINLNPLCTGNVDIVNLTPCSYSIKI